MIQEEGYDYPDMNVSSYATHPTHDAGLMEKRLDIDTERTKLIVNLTGIKVESYKGNDGVWYTREIRIGQPRVNKEGFNYIMFQYDMLYNNQVVQGNIDRSEYNHARKEIRECLAADLWEKKYQYGIKDGELHGIVQAFMNGLTFFLSRPVDNKERPSYGESKVVEQITTPEKKRGRGWLPGV